MRGSRLRSRMRSAARRRNCAISSSLAFQRWRSWRGILDQDFMRADRVHAVVDAVAAAAGFAFDVVERRGMHDGARGPGNPGRWAGANHLRALLEIGAETAGDCGTWTRLSAGSSPVMTQERVMGSLRSSIGNTGEHCERSGVNRDFSLNVHDGPGRNAPEAERRALL